MGAGHKRLFIAAPIDSRLRRLLVQAQRGIDAQGIRVRWTQEDQFHLTLKFLGETPDERIPDVARAIAAVARRHKPLHIRVGGGGCFPPDGAARVLWIGGADPDGTCAVVVQELEESLGPLGFPPENRTFSIHFTLGRVNWDSSRGKLRAQLAALAPFDHALAVNELVLYESRMSPRGSTYDILSREPLDG